jgi:alkylation response protein AidB-like acyl-CoA dehydrogenase
MGLAGGAIMSKGSIAQKERWALPLLTLEKVGAWAISEPNSGLYVWRGRPKQGLSGVEGRPWHLATAQTIGDFVPPLTYKRLLGIYRQHPTISAS